MIKDRGNGEGWADGERRRSTKAFFVEGGWEIHGNPIQHIYLSPAISRVVHYCDPQKYQGAEEYCHIWSHLKGNLSCPACSELMPDSVQTLWTLQNFDVDFGNSDRVWPTHPPHRVDQ